MFRVTISTPPRSYDAVIENNLLERSGQYLRELLGGKKLFVVSVAPVAQKWGKKLLASLSGAGFTAKVLQLRDGERYKRLAAVEALAEKLSRLGADRDTVLVAFGGGIVGDVTGLLASLYMRGVPVVQIPTTVLAQVDASVGGKTGVNLRTGKNLVGTFHQPLAVLIDPSVLATLPEREFRAGLYEVLKCGIIGNEELFARLEKNTAITLRRDAVQLEWVITQSVKLKAEVVSADEKENGLRRVLNLGHTIGHALEAATGYRHFLHGEAVAWGMIAATQIAASLNKIDKETLDRITSVVLALGPLPKVKVSSRDILQLLQTDKKTRSGVVHFVLPSQIGKVEIVNDVPTEAVLDAVNVLRQFSNSSH